MTKIHNEIETNGFTVQAIGFDNSREFDEFEQSDYLKDLVKISGVDDDSIFVAYETIDERIERIIFIADGLTLGLLFGRWESIESLIKRSFWKLIRALHSQDL